MHFSKFLSVDGAGVTKNGNQDGSGDPVYMELRPSSGTVYTVKRLTVLIEDAVTTGLAADKYGDLAALTTGIKIEAVHGTGASPTVLVDITDGELIKQHSDWEKYSFLAHEVNYSNSTPGNDTFNVEYDFSGPLILHGQLSEALRVTIADDLSGLTKHYFFAHGNETTELV